MLLNENIYPVSSVPRYRIRLDTGGVGTRVRCRYSVSVLNARFRTKYFVFKYINGTCRYSQVDKKMGHFPVLVGTGTFNFNIVKIKVLQLMFMLVRNNSKYYTCTKVQDVLQKHNLSHGMT